MPTFKLTAKHTIGPNAIPKGTTFQVITPSGVTSLNEKRIVDALQQQLGIDLSKKYYAIHVNDFDVVKL